MIIKSKGRKDTNFLQLVTYLDKEKSGMGEQYDFTYLHNIDEVENGNHEAIAKAFSENDKYRKKRKNGVAHYHDILSFSPKDSMTLKEKPSILQDIARQYISRRCPDSLAVARCHFDQDHWHIHVMYSGVEREGSKVQRITKKEFEGIKQALQQYQQEQYPELAHSYVQSRDKEKKQTYQKRSHEEWQIEEREKQLDKKTIRATIIDGLNTSQFVDYLKRKNIFCYFRRGKPTGVRYGKRKYRFSTLFKGQPEIGERIEEIFKTKEKELLESLKRQASLEQERSNRKWMKRDEGLEWGRE